jgi:hypothetical protein
MSANDDSALRSQFQLLQQQQQQKLELHKVRLESKNKKKAEEDEAKENEGVKPISAQDHLDLKVDQFDSFCRSLMFLYISIMKEYF